MPDLGKLARDTGLILLGLGIIRYQKVAVRRREIHAELGNRLAPLRDSMPPALRDLIPKPPNT